MAGMDRVLFETSYIGSVVGILHIIFVFGLFFFSYFQLKKIADTDERERDRKMTKRMIKAAKAFIAIYAIILVKDYIDVVVQYKIGNYMEIEGAVYSYSFTPDKRGPIEHFWVEGKRFECPESSWGYYPTANNKAVVGNGQHLRIRYIPDEHGNVIVYIEQMMPEEWE